MNQYLLMREFGIRSEDQAAISEDQIVRYMCLLHKVVELDGMNHAERRFMDDAQKYLQLSTEATGKLQALIASNPTIPALLATFGKEASPTIGRFIVRDAIRAALADDEYTPSEAALVAKIAKGLGISSGTVEGIRAWVQESKVLAKKWEAIP